MLTEIFLKKFLYLNFYNTLLSLKTGSPFMLRVSQQPDASKVRVTGPGVEHGILATFQSRFIVETRGAGAGQLTVRIRGPKGKAIVTHPTPKYLSGPCFFIIMQITSFLAIKLKSSSYYNLISVFG